MTFVLVLVFLFLHIRRGLVIRQTSVAPVSYANMVSHVSDPMGLPSHVLTTYAMHVCMIQCEYVMTCAEMGASDWHGCEACLMPTLADQCAP